MRLSTLGLVLVIIGIVTLAIGAYTYAYPTPQTKTSTIAPSAGIFEQLELKQGDQLKVALTVIDGEGVRVTVEDPLSETVYNGGTVYANLAFNLNAQSNGAHRINFVNISPTDELTIDYSIMYPAFPGMLTYFALILGVVLVVNGLVVILIFKRSNKQ
ncbi:MAG: hypothetical protein NWE95_02780 [Candidatus Bathyarchaeota archaeon]|nr:hypothetical protein [Candidatus Bathyarchaeota archaeon]